MSADAGEELLNVVSAPVTWVDVARRLAMLEPTDPLWASKPEALRSTRADWSSLTIEVSEPEQDRAEALRWLQDLFPGRVQNDGTELRLEGPSASRFLPIEFEQANPLPNLSRSNLGSIEGNSHFWSSPTIHRATRNFPVIACHSVKGGTGRTTTAVAVATIWALRAAKPILIVDADLEAPGLSYLFRASRPEIETSLEDLIALVHADPEPTSKETLTWVGQRLSGQRLGNLIVLPLRRDLDELASSAIRAEHLSTPDRPYAFADLLSELAATVGCAGVVVDVRAGLVPLAAQLVLDPQVGRILVTSLAAQSLEATAALVSFLSREMRKNGVQGLQPLIVVNRVPGILRELGQDEALLAPFLARLEASLLADDVGEVSPDRVLFDSQRELSPLSLVKLGEVADLQVPARRWDGFGEQLSSSGFLTRLDIGLGPWLDTFLSHSEPGPENESINKQEATLTAEASTSQDIDLRRKRLADFASQLIAAETADTPVGTPLVTGPMRALAMESAQLPILVSEGAKGTGKTLTARYLVSQGSWTNVVSRISHSKPTIDALILPVLGSIQASSNFLSEIDASRQIIATELNLQSPQTVSATREYVRDQVNRKLTERQWTDIWLDIIAWSSGFSVGQTAIWLGFLEYLSGANQNLIVIIEGVEELYDTATNSTTTNMLRSLLIDLPLRLRSVPGRPLGLVIFARRDTVDAGVAQNRAQFRQQYRDFALNWTENDVLELAAWLATSSGALHIWDTDFRSRPLSEKERALDALWGRKLGPDEQPGRPRVQEAYTAGWVVAALSDLQERLVARDLVRFLQFAAEHSGPIEGRENYGNRLLYPRALREAVGPTSRSKVTETEEEIPELKNIFQKFKENSNTVKAPIDQPSILELNLSLEDIDALRFHGIILGDAPPYEVPELFRMGLGLKHAGARYSVIGTRRRARQRLLPGR